MSIPSYERFDYQLRANKHIERKIIFDLLKRANTYFPFHSYLGLGSMWFADHRMAHRLLGINNLISIEAEDADRAHFNKPFGGITVLPGFSHEVLPNHRNWTGSTIAWMDYDGNLTPDVVSDMELFSQKLETRSVLMLTINSTFSNYRKKQSYVDSQLRKGVNVDPRAVATITSMLGHTVPAQFEDGVTGIATDCQPEQFAPFIADMFFDYMSHKLRLSGRVDSNGRALKFVPLFNITHQDGAEMLTVGGAITTAEEASIWEQIFSNDPILRSEGGRLLNHRLDLIPITLREKLVMDSLLPSEEAEFVRLATQGGIRLPVDQIEKYAQHYRHFPVFMETAA
jgi:hypothetical protein